MKWTLKLNTLALVSLFICDSCFSLVRFFEQNSVTVDIEAEIQTTLYTNSNSYFGQSEEFIGVNTDHWLEIAGEAGFLAAKETANGEVFIETTGLYTQTFGDDASGLTAELESHSEFKVEQAHIGWRSGGLFEGFEKHKQFN